MPVIHSFHNSRVDLGLLYDDGGRILWGKLAKPVARAISICCTVLLEYIDTALRIASPSSPPLLQADRFLYGVELVDGYQCVYRWRGVEYLSRRCTHSDSVRPAEHF